jgi:hypothetical protein
LKLVVSGDVKQFVFGGTQKANDLHRMADRASRSTSSALRAGMLPFLYSR